MHTGARYAYRFPLQQHHRAGRNAPYPAEAPVRGQDGPRALEYLKIAGRTQQYLHSAHGGGHVGVLLRNVSHSRAHQYHANMRAKAHALAKDLSHAQHLKS